MAKKKQPNDQIVCRNRRASHRYEILEKIECGLMLAGSEVKSLRERNGSIEEAYGWIDRGELWLVGARFSPYAFAHGQNLEPARRRKLLVHKRELRKLAPRVEQKGQTLVPLSIYFNERGIAKVLLALARGKSTSDKRESLKKREHQREMDRAVRRGGR